MALPRGSHAPSGIRKPARAPARCGRRGCPAQHRPASEAAAGSPVPPTPRHVPGRTGTSPGTGRWPRPRADCPDSHAAIRPAPPGWGLPGTSGLLPRAPPGRRGRAGERRVGAGPARAGAPPARPAVGGDRRGALPKAAAASRRRSWTTSWSRVATACSRTARRLRSRASIWASCSPAWRAEPHGLLAPDDQLRPQPGQARLRRLEELTMRRRPR